MTDIMGGFGIALPEDQGVTERGSLNAAHFGRHKREIEAWCQRKPLQIFEGRSDQ